MIIIDEVDALVSDEMTAYQREATTALNVNLGFEKDNRTGTIVVITGYPSGIRTFIAHNPGFDRRFPNRYFFNDYTPAHLEEIFQYIAKKRGYTVASDTVRPAMQEILKAKQYLGEKFGNAGAVENFLEKMEDAHADGIGQEDLRSALGKGSVLPELAQRLSVLDRNDLAVFDSTTCTFKRPSAQIAASRKADGGGQKIVPFRTLEHM